MPTRSCPSITGRRRTLCADMVRRISCTSSSAPMVTASPWASSPGRAGGRVLAGAQDLHHDVPVGQDTLQPVVGAADRQGADPEVLHLACRVQHRLLGADAFGSAGHDVSRLGHGLPFFGVPPPARGPGAAIERMRRGFPSATAGNGSLPAFSSPGSRVSPAPLRAPGRQRTEGGKVQLSFLQPLFDRPGPWATVYFDPLQNDESGAKRRELSVREACRTLEEEGADAATTEAVRDALLRIGPAEDPAGRVVFAAGGEVVLSHRLSRPRGGRSAAGPAAPADAAAGTGGSGPRLPRGVHRPDGRRPRTARGGRSDARGTGRGGATPRAPHGFVRLVRAALPAQGREHLGAQRR